MYGFIGDLHIGVNLPNDDYLKSLNMYYGLIKECKEECKGIFIVGDLFDHRLSIEENKFAALFIANLVCNGVGKNGKNVPVYFVHGTFNHDLNQYEEFIPLLERMKGIEFKYFKTACETVIDGHSVLVIPHETGNLDYSQFHKEYDLIVGHGVIMSDIKPVFLKNVSGMRFSDRSLGEMSKLCVFGHFHGYTDFGNGVYYTGPWLRWKYGEDTKRVFFFCDDNFNVFTRDNPFAIEYRTIEIENPDELREAINVDISTPHRFIINATPNNIDTYRGIILSTAQNKNIRYQLTEIIENKDTNNDAEKNEQLFDDVWAKPIPQLMEYIMGNYGINTEEQLTNYENRLRKDLKE